MALEVERLEARDCPAPLVLASSGGWLYGLDPATGEAVRSLQLDPGFDGPLHPAAVDSGDFVVGAGQGGGPRLVRYDGITWRPEWSRFVGDPNSRTGVDSAYLDALAGEGNLSPLEVLPHYAAPGNPEAVALTERHLAAMPDTIEEWLARRGQVYLVYSGEITDLPEFRAKKGIPGWENVGSLGPLALGDPIYLQDGSPGAHVVYHETGHAVIAWASEEQYAAGDPYQQWWNYRWEQEIWPNVVWGGYDNRNWGEAWAESFARRLTGVAQPSPLVDTFLDEFWAAMGW